MARLMIVLERIEDCGSTDGLLIRHPLEPGVRSGLAGGATLGRVVARAWALGTDGKQAGHERAGQEGADQIENPPIQSDDPSPGRAESPRTTCAHWPPPSVCGLRRRTVTRS